ncbi:MAG TPA: hypothetical protein GX737_07915 [Oligoflexales bacterium]|nr:hypothetical protein [Oligoflexales bacterium]
MNAKKLAVILAILVVTALVLVWQFRPKDNSDDVPDVASEPTQITQEEPDTQSSILLNDKDIWIRCWLYARLIRLARISLA